MTIFEKALIIHLVADWLLQNDWMANHKASIRHWAAWIHGSIHFLGMLLIFSLPVALALGATHMLIDTRKPLTWWRGVFRQTQISENVHAGWHVAIWSDQVVHLTCIALAIWLTL